MQTHGKGIESLHCLVLKARTNDTSANKAEVLYERIGVLELDQDGEPEHWLTDTEVMTVTIV